MKKSTLILALSMLVLTSCPDMPSQNNQSVHGTINVFWAANDWPSQNRDWMAQELTYVSALGPSFVLVADPVGSIVVEHWDSGNGCPLGAADWTPSLRRIRIDPVCTHGELEFKTALGHELGHSVGMGHICRTAGELTNCSPVGTGPAMMNPRLSYGDSEITSDQAYEAEVAPVWPHALDLSEYNRVHP